MHPCFRAQERKSNILGEMPRAILQYPHPVLHPNAAEIVVGRRMVAKEIFDRRQHAVPRTALVRRVVQVGVVARGGAQRAAAMDNSLCSCGWRASGGMASGW